MVQTAKKGKEANAKSAASAQSTEDSSSADAAFWGAAGKISFPYFKFENVGDRVKGVYVGKFQSISSKYGYSQENYVLVQEDGSKIVVGGRSARKSDSVRVMYGIEKVPVGGVVGFIFEGEKDTGKGNPAKLINLRYTGEVKKDVATKFATMFNMDQIAVKVADIERPGEGSGVESADEIPFE